MSTVYSEGIDFKILDMKLAGGENKHFVARLRDNRTQQVILAFNRWGSWMFTDENESFMRDMNVGIAAALQEHKRKVEREIKKLADMGWV